MSSWLIASHLKTGASRRFELSNQPLVVGRTSGESSTSKFNIDFDPTLSRNHFEAHLSPQGLKIKRLESKHPLYFQGTIQDEFTVQAGQHFTSGQSSFEFRAQAASLGQPTRSGTVLLDLNQLRELDSDRCLKAVLDLQPLLNSGQSERQLLCQTLPILANIVPMASAIFLMATRTSPSGGTQGGGTSLDDFEELASIGDPELIPSRTLLRQVVSTGESICYSWEGQAVHMAATMVAGSRWALASPLILDIGEGPQSFVLYAVGSEVALNLHSSGRTPGDLDRAVLTFAAGLLKEHIRARRHAARAEAENRRAFIADSLHRILTSLTSTFDPLEILAGLREHLQHLVGFQSIEVFTDLGPPEFAEWLSGVSTSLLLTNGDRCRLALRLRRREVTHGYLVIERLENGFREEEILLAESLCNQAALALDNASLFAATERLATHDELTGVHNRRHFFQATQLLLSECQVQDKPWALAIFDVDHFKKFNDTYGHATGDAVLQLVARTGAQHFGKPAIFARYGGEEFALACQCRLEELSQRAECLRQAVAEAVLESEGQQLSVTISIGVSAPQSQTDELKLILAQADQALYRAKERGRNRVECFQL